MSRTETSSQRKQLRVTANGDVVDITPFLPNKTSDVREELETLMRANQSGETIRFKSGRSCRQEIDIRPQLDTPTSRVREEETKLRRSLQKRRKDGRNDSWSHLNDKRPLGEIGQGRSYLERGTKAADRHDTGGIKSDIRLSVHNPAIRPSHSCGPGERLVAGAARRPGRNLPKITFHSTLPDSSTECPLTPRRSPPINPKTRRTASPTSQQKPGSSGVKTPTNDFAMKSGGQVRVYGNSCDDAKSGSAFADRNESIGVSIRDLQKFLAENSDWSATHSEQDLHQYSKCKRLEKRYIEDILGHTPSPSISALDLQTPSPRMESARVSGRLPLASYSDTNNSPVSYEEDEEFPPYSPDGEPTRTSPLPSFGYTRRLTCNVELPRCDPFWEKMTSQTHSPREVTGERNA